jgi:hypothetical protein
MMPLLLSADAAFTGLFLFPRPGKDVELLMAFVRVSSDGNSMSREIVHYNPAAY